MGWNFGEGVPIGDSSGGFSIMVERFAYVLSGIGSDWLVGEMQRASATKHPLPDDSAAAFITDPPYYDAVPYSDLSDFFYVWLKRMLPHRLLTTFADELAPKGDECIVDEVKGKDNSYFENTMKQAMAEGRRVLNDHGIGIVVFAHKSTAGWEAQLQAMVDAGWVMTGSWPIDTEMGSRFRARDSAALASSVHLVCRPRANSATANIGEWRDVLSELPLRIHEWMPRLAAEGVVGADAIFACLVPALEIFSRYSRVEKASGEAVPLREYLEQVWAAVSTEALSMIFKDADAAGLEPDARLTARWLWTISGGAAGKDEGGRMKAEKRKKKKPKQRSLFEELDELEAEAEATAGELKPRAGETVLDRVHQSMILFASGRGEALRRFLVEDGAGTDARFWKLAQSLSALYPKETDEKRWVDGVLARKKGLGL